MNDLLEELRGAISTQLNPDELAWFGTLTDIPLERAFVMAPRKIQRKSLIFTYLPERMATQAKAQLWTLDRLVRIYCVLQLDAAAATHKIHTLFDTAELQEAVALYSSLPYLSHPTEWLLRATDAIRSNVAHVFAAMALGNPYPASHFSELAWNQLVLKAIFNDQPLAEIHGLLERKNPTLAQDICLLAQERWAAGRRIPAFAWCLVADMSYPEESQMISRLAASDDMQDQRAALFLQQKSSDFATTWFTLV